MKRTDTIIIGGGQAGLAMSRCLSDRGIDHVVLERGRIAERWRSERWDSLRLLTPNWQSRLPGQRYAGDDPDGFMTMPQVIRYFERYARTFDAPVQDGTTVLRVEPTDANGYRVTTDRGVLEAANVVIATGQCDVPRVPGIAARLDDDVDQIVPSKYRNPGQLRSGGVLVVGASASGLQLADEIARSGRDVTLAVGRHTRLPRTYRGRDILRWFADMGLFDDRIEDVPDPERSRNQPSMQLVGRADHATLDLNALQDAGVRLAGRAVAADGGRVLFSDDLEENVAAADRKLVRLLWRIDDHIDSAALGREVSEAAPIRPVRPATAPTALDLRVDGISTVLWATGFRRSYPWLKVPVLDARGEILHRGGITPAPGLYVLGLQFLRRRNSNFIDGVGRDALDLTAHLAGRLHGRRTAAA